MAWANLVESEFGFHVEYVDKDNRVLRDERLKPCDFGHAIRHTRFDAFRHGLVKQYEPLADGTRIEPLFPADNLASPRARGFRVTIALPDGGEHGCEFGISYFGSSAHRMRAELKRAGQFDDDQDLCYRLTAYLDEEEVPRPDSKLAIKLEAATQGIPATAGCRRDFGGGQAWDDPSISDLPVLVDQGVLEEVVAEAKATPEHEVAGFLLGHLKWDKDVKELFLAVTGLASARGTTEASGTSVTYTPASFAQVRNIIKLRAASEIVCGWFHSHPFRLCAECPLPTPPECIAKVLFYSQDDIHLMETTFEQPFMVGLLAAIDDRIERAVGHVPVKLYGWRDGEIKARGFEVVRPTKM